MGWSFRKSVNFGPVRFNFSKSGVGYSVGNKFFRAGRSAKGQSYRSSTIPGTGFTYREYDKSENSSTDYTDYNSSEDVQLEQEEIIFDLPKNKEQFFKNGEQYAFENYQSIFVYLCFILYVVCYFLRDTDNGHANIILFWSTISCLGVITIQALNKYKEHFISNEFLNKHLYSNIYNKLIKSWPKVEAEIIKIEEEQRRKEKAEKQQYEYKERMRKLASQLQTKSSSAAAQMFMQFSSTDQNYLKELQDFDLTFHLLVSMKLTITDWDCDQFSDFEQSILSALSYAVVKQIDDAQGELQTYIASRTREDLERKHIAEYTLGICFEHCGLIPESKKWFKKCFDRRPGFKDVAYRLNNSGRSQNSEEYESESRHEKPTKSFEEDNPYTILQISPSANESEIKAAYRKLMSEYHPDKVANLGKELRDLAEKKSKLINWAYETLIKKVS